jgi:hypothetical protein
MPLKRILLSAIVAVATAASGQVDISGNVQESKNKTPVAGANIKVLGLNLTAITDAEGKFTITGTSVLHPEIGAHGRVPVVDEYTLVFPQETDGEVLIRIVDCRGRLQTVLHSGFLANGLWRVHPPRQLPGMYLCVFDAPDQQYAVRFLVSTNGSGRNAGSMELLEEGTDHGNITAARCAAVPDPVDTLLVEKNGFRSARLPLTGYQTSSISILLEDTTTVDLNDVTIVPDPSWTCFMKDGIPPPEKGKEVFTVKLNYAAIHDVGLTKFGYRRQFDISGGSVKGDKIDATVSGGGLDYELKLSNGSYEIEQINILRAGSTPILMRNAGVAPAGAEAARVVLDFEAPNSSSYTWLHDGPFAANRMVDSTAKTITLVVYDISGVQLTDAKVRITDPEGVENQTWDCVKMSGSQGTQVFTENVSLGGSVSIGQTKRGSRNIIPITGGTTTGKVVGNILDGGADYQLGGLDARYTLAPNDGEFIIVRNCGSGTLYPVFEARVAGPYNYLNENKYVSSSPGPGTGGVSITFYEQK